MYDTGTVTLEKANYFKDLCQGKTEAIFQIESNLFKGLVKDMMPQNISDITALLSIGRPGPLSAGMHTAYAKRKRGEETWHEPLPNTLDIIEDTFGTIIYQEQPMKIAQRVAGFDGNHADTFLRKAMAKKHVELLKLCKRWFVWGKRNTQAPEGYDATNEDQVMYDPEGQYGAPILGGINNGYEEEMLITFFDSLEGYASYLFNRSHSAAYAWITCVTAYLAHYYRPQYMAQVLSIEEKNEKIDFYIDNCRSYGITVLPPDINLSDEDFKATDKGILYGLKTIARVGKACENIIANRPYASLQEMYDKLKPNKGAFENLIKAGCFDFIDTNRYALLNTIYDIRKDKPDKVLRFIPSDYDKAACRLFEETSIKTYLTYPSLYKYVPSNTTIVLACKMHEFSERRDKKGNMMGFYKLEVDEEIVTALCFSKMHAKIRLELEAAVLTKKVIYLKGKKDPSNKFLISSKQFNDAGVFTID